MIITINKLGELGEYNSKNVTNSNLYKICNYRNDNNFELPAEKIEKLVDTTGAGDAFAAGFLYGLVNDFDLKKSAGFGNVLASRIIQKFGARFEQLEIVKLK